MFPQLVALAVLASGAVAQFTVNTPVAVQCQPVLITWTGGTPPYFLSIVDGNNPSGTALESLSSNLNAQSFTWKVDQAANTKLAVDLRDSTGTLVQSGVFSVQSSSDSSCLGAGASGSASGSSAGATGATGSSSPSSTGSSGASSTKSGSASSSTSTKSAGERTAVHFGGAAALVGAAVAALL